jgi:hypothetical protein
MGARLGVVMVVLVSAWSAVAGASDLAVGKWAKVYAGPQGETVTIVRLEPAQSREYLIKFEGVEGLWDGKILLHRRSIQGEGEREDYRLKADESYSSVTVRGGAIEAHPKGTRKAVPLHYSKEASANATPQVLLPQFLEQEKAGRAGSP